MQLLRPKSILTFIAIIISISVVSCSSSGSKIRTSSKSSSNKKEHYIKNKAIASYYHDKFNGRKTASGERFDNSDYTAAHRELAFGTQVRVTNLANNKSVIVKINDRGPFSKGREIDLSKKAFMKISDKKTHGELTVKIEVIN